MNRYFSFISSTVEPVIFGLHLNEALLPGKLAREPASFNAAYLYSIAINFLMSLNNNCYTIR